MAASEAYLITAAYGGTGNGTLFSIGTKATGALHTFSFTDGAYPSGDLALASNEAVYGTIMSGGAYGYGTVYEFSGNTFQTLYSFKGGDDGATPVGGVTPDSAGNVYGFTEYGGTGTGQGNGTISKIAPDGAKTTLYSMDSHTGTHPTGNLVLSPAGDLYGTTTCQAGAKPVPSDIFKVTQAGVGSAVHRFATTDGTDRCHRLAQPN